MGITKEQSDKLRPFIKERHDDWYGPVEDQSDKDVKYGFVTGYQQAINDICETMDIKVDNIINSITKL